MQIGGIEWQKAELIIKLQGIVKELSKLQADLEEEFGAVNVDLQTGAISHATNS